MESDEKQAQRPVCLGGDVSTWTVPLVEQPAAAEARARGQDSGALCAACATCPPIHQPTAPPPPQTTTTGGVRLQLQALTLLISSRHAWLPPEAGCAKETF